MNLLLLLDMVAAGRGDEVVVQSGDERLTAAELLAGAWAAAGVAAGSSALAYVGTNGLAFPIGLFGAAAAGVPFVPLNYRLSHDQLHDLLAPLGDTLVVADGEAGEALAARGHRVVDTAEFVATARAGEAVGEVPADGEGPAVLLYTSGTTAAPKAAVLRHRHLTSYVIGTVEFAGAGPDEAVLVSVPPYHVAGLANLLSNLYLGRRIVYLTQFDAAAWVAAVRRRGHHQRHGRAHDAGPHLRRARGRRRRPPEPAGAVLRRGPHARHRAAARHGAAARRRPHQRLRADRDELDDRGPRARRPPGRPGRRSRGDGPAVVGGAGAAHRRDRGAGWARRAAAGR